MWIVYISIAIVVVAIIMLGVSIIRTLKTTKPVINRMNEQVESIQERMNKLTDESSQLQATQKEIQKDIEFKKDSFTMTIEEAKDLPRSIKSLLKNIKA
ncbi:DUF948 domain-containing protein [Rossellomorea marisflavi]|uniref:DUF948 domain-containing protein n=1 Tax=Rossellomorea marisflavi TaxID=189381 RepID=UPI003515ABC1